jgi:EAL domain-containing protein (putative c-di-GMP-specific phosphodiesterase class I)
LCRARAFEAALEMRLHPSLTLFVNCEPSALGSPCPAHLRPVVDAARRQLRVVTEFTERELAVDPAALLAGAAASRQAGWGVAMDDVGAAPESLSFLPFVHPDVIKLDMRLVQDRPGPDVAEIASAVMAQAERTGAVILAEGIETEAHVQVARILGATIGQGWLFGRPQPPSTIMRPAATAVPIPLFSPPDTVAGTTPFDAVAARRPLTRAAKDLLLPMSHHIEDQLLRHNGGLLLACFQEARHFTPATARRFGRLADNSSLVAALGVGMPQSPVPGVRGANLHDGDRLSGEWTVAVIGTHFASALVSRDLGDTGPDHLRRFDFTITHDRDLVLTAARALLRRITPLHA